MAESTLKAQKERRMRKRSKAMQVSAPKGAACDEEEAGDFGESDEEVKSECDTLGRSLCEIGDYELLSPGCRSYEGHDPGQRAFLSPVRHVCEESRTDRGPLLQDEILLVVSAQPRDAP